jgi:Ca2+-binding RTX toxin-like protein
MTRGLQRGRRRWYVIGSLLSAGVVAMGLVAALTLGASAPVGQGFTVTSSDLSFILKQIKIAERHSNAFLTNTPPNPDPVGDPVYCQSMIGPDPDQVATTLLSFGLRTVDGSCNNLQPGQGTFGAADQPFPRLTNPVFNAAEDATAFGGPSASSYAQTSGAVADSEPRTVSNLIVDQTSTNPAAVAAAGYPLRSQGNEGVFVCGAPSAPPPPDCVPEGQTLDIPNVTTDVGLSPPFNSLFTIFGQFFDHGLDKITNGGNGTVFVPLKADDPLITSGVVGPNDPQFMSLTRGKIVPGAGGIRNAPNTDTPFVDQSQTYTSHASHQVFTREYVNNNAGLPVSTGKFLSSPDGGLPTWAQVKAQAETMLGLRLVDADVNNIPMIFTDPYGNFVPFASNDPDTDGTAQFVTPTGALVHGNRATPVSVADANAAKIGTAFLNDIAHSASPYDDRGALKAGGKDTDTAIGGSLDQTVPANSYDNELLDIHAICGDGRCNENIALQSIHQIFHNEHDRLIDNIEDILKADTSGVTNLADWQLASGAPDPNSLTDVWNGQRLFQAARFVTEMQYQHLVFEEFARKVQPAINPFEPFAFNQTDVNPAITAEFAHAVYRFGHSMLTDSIPRLNADGSVPACDGVGDASGVVVNNHECLSNDIELFDGFLNPAAYHDGGAAGPLSSQEAAGAIIMGLSDQTGQEIDEFVADTLRNRLLGLPLDLPSLNMTRARSEGIPSLNNVRRQIHAATNDSQMAPYTDWVDWGQALKHPESLVNFVASYGTHGSIFADPDGPGPLVAGTLKARRVAADQIVNGTVLPGPDGVVMDDPNTPGDESADNFNPPTDSADFMFSTGAWANTGTTSTTGVDDIDLWVGGLAEHTNLFGGLLGSTFNYVFENQLTNLQNGDRFYYLARTPGMNLRAQLEGNSFSELVMRNTNAHTLKADPFATADCKFELSRITWPAPFGSFLTGPGSVKDDPVSDCNENRLLLNSPTWDVRYRLTNSVDPAGINGQAVYNGTDGANKIFGGVDNDTFWGGKGNDIIEGSDGADIPLGGEGNDIITDSAGDDVLKGGPGNDAMDAGPGLDILMGGDGKDFTNGGANANETFAGDGDDFAIAGQGTDAVFGDSGDDWQEGGDQPDLLIGDSSTLFFDDHNLPGHDILIGQGGDDDYDMEGGDDIGVGGPGVEKNAGASGWDWITGQGDPQPQNQDLALPIVNAPPANETRDRFNEVEALSGWNLNDTLRGDDVVPSQVGGIGFIGCDALDQAGLDRIAGLDALVPPLTVPLADVTANSVTNFCLLTGPFVWGEGNILLGGGGSDTLEGRGADDILDGDKYLSVRLSIRANSDGTGAEIASTNLMENVPTGSGWTGSLAGKTLQQAVFAGLIDPGRIVAVREISTPTAAAADCSAVTPLNCDTAVFSAAFATYAITPNADGSVTVDSNGGVDGIDTLWNIERLRFADALVNLAPTINVSPASLAFGNQIVNTTSAAQTITVTNTGLALLTVSGVTVAGADPTAFSAVNGCLAPLARAGTCTVSVTFRPTTAGAKSASVNIASNDTESPTKSVAVSGTGVVVVVPPAPTTVADAFNRANATTLGANWQQVVVPILGAALRVNGNQASAAITGSAYFTTAGGATQSAGFTYVNATLNNTALYLKATGPLGGVSGQLQNAVRVLYNGGNVTVSTTTNGNVNAPTYTAASPAISTGGALVNGNRLQAAVDNAGRVWVWKVVGATTTLLTPTGVQLPNNALWTTGAGRVGMLLPTGARVDDFVRG